MDLIPLCLYTNFEDLNSYIGYSENKNCNYRPELEFVTQFYVVNPEFKPIPIGMTLFCAEDTADSTFSTISIKQVYDYIDDTNYNKNCVYFIAWNEKVPNTIPLYIMKYGSGLYISLTKEEKLESMYYSPIYVLKDDKVKFKFENSRCYPYYDNDVNYTSLYDCTKKYVRNNIQPTILTLLEEKYKKPKTNNIKLFIFLSIIIIIIIFFIILIVRSL